MKKLLLFMAAGCVVAGANAQNTNLGGLENAERFTAHTPIEVNAVDRSAPLATANKTTAGDTTRWYSHLHAIQQLNLTTITRRLMPMWFDSTVLVAYTSGLSAINFSSAAQVIDPAYFKVFNSANYYSPSALAVEPTMPYKVDSIAIRAAYIENPNRPAGIVDTLILSVAPNTSSWNYTANATTNAWVSNYIPSTQTQLVGPAPTTVNTARLTNGSTSAVVFEKYLTDADRDPDSAGFVTIKTFVYAVPNGGVNIPAGSQVAITVTFKSGDVVANPNVDSVNEYHRFSLVSHGSTTERMAYLYYSENDRNMSSLMFTTDQTPSYSPAPAIEGWQTDPVQFSFEHHDIQAHVRCGTCRDIQTVTSVSDLNNIATVNVYPNPANDEVRIPVTVGNAASIQVSLLNTVGQIISTMDLGKVAAGQTSTATFSTASLPAGVYIYNVNADGQQKNGKVVIAH